MLNYIPAIEFVYLVSGALLPLFYVPQIVKLWHDNTMLASYSLSKATAQLLLRLPALAFAVTVVNHTYMTVVLSADIAGRLIEFLVALRALRRQGVGFRSIASRFNPAHAWAKPVREASPVLWADDAWGMMPHESSPTGVGGSGLNAQAVNQ